MCLIQHASAWCFEDISRDRLQMNISYLWKGHIIWFITCFAHWNLAMEFILSKIIVERKIFFATSVKYGLKGMMIELKFFSFFLKQVQWHHKLFEHLSHNKKHAGIWLHNWCIKLHKNDYLFSKLTSILPLLHLSQKYLVPRRFWWMH